MIFITDKKLIDERAKTITPAEVLRRAWDLIANPIARAYSTMATDQLGNSVMPTAPKACKWCSTGAVKAIIGENPPRLLEEAIWKAFTKAILRIKEEYPADAYLQKTVDDLQNREWVRPAGGKAVNTIFMPMAFHDFQEKYVEKMWAYAMQEVETV